ncbi:MAG: ROK family protein [Deltaproteobacteria bacterium]|nr:ROK family protein [Deltaproteobacteria bacterium]
MRYNKDDRVVLTLDAGGTNLVFSAIQGEKEIVEPIVLPSYGDNLDLILRSIVDGFSKVQAKLADKAAAISFCFPGPADYERGIIGDLVNLPCFRGGVALGPMLEDTFKMPAFMNNDGDLFAYGEAIAGILPEINGLLKSQESPKSYQNLLGATLGTGFGGGIVAHGNLLVGDNSAQGEINRMRNSLYHECPEEIFEIGMRKRKGDRKAAVMAFEELAIVAGDALAAAVTLVDGLIVIGGGLSLAYPLFLQKMVDQMNKKYKTMNGSSLEHLEIKVFNLNNKDDLKGFVEGNPCEIMVPFSNRKIRYDSLKRVGVGTSKLGTMRAVSVGAYTFALDRLDGR